MTAIGALSPNVSHAAPESMWVSGYHGGTSHTDQEMRSLSTLHVSRKRQDCKANTTTSVEAAVAARSAAALMSIHNSILA